MVEYRRMTKDVIRQNIRAIRQKQDSLEKEKNDQKIYTRLENFEPFKNAKSVLFYASKEEEGEVDTWALIKKNIQEKKVSLPRTSSGEQKLSAHIIKNLEDLENGSYQIKEPKETCPEIGFEKIDLIIVPGIAFDRAGHRIGYGKGFYDRSLKAAHCPIVALAYDFQIVQSIPGENHDVKMDYIITEKEILNCKQIPITTPY